jgi:AraC family transcriptional regulator, regulatory protein of adaptative response / methylated-DNA-[protein]-cysteine methyltransferase
VRFSLQNTTDNSYPSYATRDRVSSDQTAVEVIQLGISQCSLGRILVASSPKGVCAILLGDDPKALSEDLHFRFPKTKLIAGDTEFERLATKVVQAVEAPASKPDFPLDLRGTEFQQRVWRALGEIPAGSTATYQEIAQKIRMSKTAQDVAEVCSANPLAVAVPRHRVIRSDGGLAGYRWGIKRKRALLEKEKVAVPEPGSLFHAAPGTH